MEIRYTSEFKRNLRVLAKKYHHIRSDLQVAIDRLLAGQKIGDQVSKTHYTIFKARVKNSDISKGKSSGYRLIYWFRTPKDVILVTIYSKLDQKDISAEKIRRIIGDISNSNAVE